MLLFKLYIVSRAPPLPSTPIWRVEANPTWTTYNFFLLYKLYMHEKRSHYRPWKWCYQKISYITSFSFWFRGLLDCQNFTSSELIFKEKTDYYIKGHPRHCQLLSNNRLSLPGACSSSPRCQIPDPRGCHPLGLVISSYHHIAYRAQRGWLLRPVALMYEEASACETFDRPPWIFQPTGDLALLSGTAW